MSIENTNKIRNILIVAAYVLLMTLFFFGGYAVGGIEQKPIAVVSTPQPNTIPAAAVQSEENVKYELILINSELFLYKNTSNSHELLYSHPITENIFPKEDTEELKKGIYFEKLEDAQSLLENFVS